MAVYSVYFIPHHPDLDEHSVEPAVEYASRWLAEHERAMPGRTTLKDAEGVEAITFEPLPRDTRAVLACEWDVRRWWFVRVDNIGQKIGHFVDVTSHFVEGN